MNNRGFLKSSEAIIASYLESLGFKILDVHRKIVVNDVEISDVDLLAEREGVLYAVEIKSGGIDVDAIRQAYVNALLVKARPLIAGRGIADERARVAAKELGVDIILLPDLVVLSLSDVRDAVYEAVYSVAGELLSTLALCNSIGEEDLNLLRVIGESGSFLEAMERLGLDEKTLASGISKLRDKGILPRGSYRDVVLIARVITLCRSLFKQGV